MALNDYPYLHWWNQPDFSCQNRAPFATNKQSLNCSQFKLHQLPQKSSLEPALDNYITRWGGNQNQGAPQPAPDQYDQKQGASYLLDSQMSNFESALENFLSVQTQRSEKLERSFKNLNSKIDLLVIQNKLLQIQVAQQAIASSLKAPSTFPEQTEVNMQGERKVLSMQCAKQSNDPKLTSKDAGAPNQNATNLSASDEPASNQMIGDSKPKYVPPPPYMPSLPFPQRLAQTKLNTDDSCCKFDCIEEMVDEDSEEYLLDDLFQFSLEHPEQCCSKEVIETAQFLDTCLSLHSNTGALEPLMCDSSRDATPVKPSGENTTEILKTDAPAPDDVVAAKSATDDLDSNTCSIRDNIWCTEKYKPPMSKDGPNHDYLLEFLTLDPG